MDLPRSPQLRRKATCHPFHRQRWAVQGIYCKECVPREPVILREDGPAPAVCPHCQTPPPRWAGDDLERLCVACGQIWQRRLVAAYL